MFHHQLPAYSPLPLRAVLAGALTVFRQGVSPERRLLEALIQEKGLAAGLLLDSGTSALRMALELLSDEGCVPVAIPAFSCFDVATAAVGARVPVMPYDIDPETLSPDLESLQRALARGARTVVAAPLFGFPVDWRAVGTLSAEHGAVLVEDAAQGHGSVYMGKASGTHGDIVVLSFGRGKGWTGGGGGALLAREARWGEQLAAAAPPPRPGGFGEIRHLIGAAAIWTLARPSLYGLPRRVPGLGLGETHYHDPTPAGAIRQVGAAIALRSREVAEAEIRFRQSVADRYRKDLAANRSRAQALVPIRPVEGGTSGYLRFPLVIEPSSDAGSAVDGRLRRLGAERSYPHPLGNLAALQGLLAGGGWPSPGARKLAKTLVTLPTHSKIRTAERSELVRLLGSGTGTC